ncbi:MAG TPA: hypothetical protein VD815_11125 [Candidatus Saccharimonadales bacterium]|nr:hypothetical protein [Candidatus Saccharimonadales bacterium]
MAESAYGCGSNRFVEKILQQDLEMSIKVTEKNMQVKEIYELFRQRLELYDKALLLPLHESHKALLTFKKAEVCMDLKMFKFKRDLLRDLNELADRIEKIEGQLIDK